MNVFELMNTLPKSIAEEEMLTKLLGVLGEVLNTKQSPDARKKILSDITKYLERKRAPRLSGAEDELDYLKYVRNALAHKNLIPDEAIRVAIPMFWRALRDAATESSWNELSHILSYTLAIKKSPPVGNNSPVRSRIKKYEDIFNKIEWPERADVFRRLLLTVYSTPEFQHYVKKSRVGGRARIDYD